MPGSMFPPTPLSSLQVPIYMTNVNRVDENHPYSCTEDVNTLQFVVVVFNLKDII